ncbi:RHS repeat-associated core domain-containing protein, partial [Psychrobacter sp. AOP5-CZ1-12]|uniref:RHS repeat-associated core domain-containing protein n=1 Tax=Psychrobacter sp. AOP5-CZ1-12 TaxID=3457651 RepID=UPI00402BA3FD
HFDVETGLHYNRFRYYDPDMGMFTTRDPIGLMGGSNVFAYAPNPTGWVDPLGLAAAVAGGAAVLGESVGATAAAPVAAVVAAGAGGYWLGTKINDGLEANGLSIGSEIYDLIHPEEKQSTCSSCKPAIKDVEPEDFCEQLALAEAKAGAGRHIMKGQKMSDEPRLIAHYGSGPWIKKEHVRECTAKGRRRKVTIHYFHSESSNKNVELKFTKR